MPMTILLLGTDASHNSDSQILVRLDPQAKTISMLSLPRDLMVDIPGVGTNKLNAAYTYGGVKLAAQTFHQITGVPIHPTPLYSILGNAVILGLLARLWREGADLAFI